MIRPDNTSTGPNVNEGNPKARPSTTLAGRGGRCKQHLGEEYGDDVAFDDDNDDDNPCQEGGAVANNTLVKVIMTITINVLIKGIKEILAALMHHNHVAI